jgi:hypothetical protein
MPSSKQQTTQATTTAPWESAQPALNTAISGAQKLYKAGTGGEVYKDSTVIPWSSQSTQAMNNIQNTATANSGGAGLSGQYQGIIDNGGFNAPQLDALNNTRSVANGNFDINADPGFQQVMDLARNSVNGAASGAGRYGSGIHQQTMTNTIGDLGARQYQNWQTRKDAANANMFGMGQQGLGNLGTAYTGMQAPNTDLMNVGAMNEDLATRQMNDKLRIFNEGQSKPWEQIGRLNAIASGAGQMGGTSTQSQPGQNPFLTALGYGATGAGLLGSFF